MPSQVIETYKMYDLGADGLHTTTDASENLGGILAKVSGTVTITSAAGTILADAIPLTAGVYTPIPANVGVGATVQLAGSADGTLFAAG